MDTKMIIDGFDIISENITEIKHNIMLGIDGNKTKERILRDIENIKKMASLLERHVDSLPSVNYGMKMTVKKVGVNEEDIINNVMLRPCVAGSMYKCLLIEADSYIVIDEFTSIYEFLKAYKII